MVWACFKFFIKLVDGNTDLIQVAMLSELDPARHHVNVEALHVGIAYVCTRIRDDGESTLLVVSGVLLAMHVIRFFSAEIAILPCRIEYLLGFVNMNMNFRLTLGTGQNQGVAELAQRFAQLAAIDIRGRYDAFGAKAVLGLVVSLGELDSRLYFMRDRNCRHWRHCPVLHVLGHASDDFGKSLGA